METDTMLEVMPRIQSTALIFDTGAIGGPHIADSPQEVLGGMSKEVLTQLLQVLRTQAHLGSTTLIPVAVSANIIAILIGLLRNHGINVVQGAPMRLPKKYGAVVVFRPENAWPLHPYQLYQALNEYGYGGD